MTWVRVRCDTGEQVLVVRVMPEVNLAGFEKLAICANGTLIQQRAGWHEVQENRGGLGSTEMRCTYLGQIPPRTSYTMLADIVLDLVLRAPYMIQ